MKVKITIEVSLEELNEYIDSYKECNYDEVPTLKQIKQSYIDCFMADKSDFINPDEIEIYFN